MRKPFEDIVTRHDRLKRLHPGILMFPGIEVLDFAERCRNPDECWQVPQLDVVVLHGIGHENKFT